MTDSIRASFKVPEMIHIKAEEIEVINCMIHRSVTEPHSFSPDIHDTERT